MDRTTHKTRSRTSNSHRKQEKIPTSADTPFLQEPLLSEFGPISYTRVGQQVLQGTYIPPHNIPEHVKVSLKHLKADIPPHTHYLHTSQQKISNRDGETKKNPILPATQDNTLATIEP